MDLLERAALEWLHDHAFHRRALEIAHRAGGFDLACGYIEGDWAAVRRVASHFNLYAAFFSLPENQPAVTMTGLCELLAAIYGGRR